LLLLAGPAPAGPGEPDPGAAALGEPDPGAATLGAAGLVAEGSGLLLLVVNGVEGKDVPVVIRKSDVLVRVSDLESAGLRNFAGRRETVSGELYVSLASLSPQIVFRLDEKAVALRITAQAAALPLQRVDLAPAPPPIAEPSGDSSAFLNYTAQINERRELFGFGEAGANVAGALLYSGVSWTADNRVVRGLSNVTIDRPEATQRWIAGDSFASLGSLGGGALLGGLSVSREFSTDPYRVHSPLPGASGATQTPSTLQVFVNGALVHEEQIAPGRFELTNVPVSTGAGTIRTVLRDAFGRETEIASPYYFNSGLLRPGLSDYSYSAGVQRLSFASESVAYGAPLLLGRHRWGLTDFFTGGLRFELGEGLQSGGATLTFGTGFGDVEIAGAASRDASVPGRAASFIYTLTTRLITVGARVQALSDHYANSSLRAFEDRRRLEVNLAAGIPVGRSLTVSLEGDSSFWRDQPRSDTASMRASVFLGRGLYASLSGGATRVEGGRPVSEFAAGLLWAFDERSIASASQVRRDGGAMVSALDAQRSLPLANGVGYRLHAEKADQFDQPTGSALLQYQGDHGRYELNGVKTLTGYGGSFSAAGGLAFIDGSIFATRPLQDGFALVRVPGVGNVHAFLNNQEVGTTDSSGALLVPNLTPYLGNRLSIRDTDLPLDFQLAAVERVTSAPLRGGTIVRFPARRLSGVSGSVIFEWPTGRTAVPAYGELSVELNGEQITSPIGAEGRFYLEDLPPGLYPADVSSRIGDCKLTLSVSDQASAIQELGELRCRPEKGAVLLARAGEDVAGEVFIDLNGDGLRNPDEPGLENVTLVASGQTIRTGPGGRFVLSNLRSDLGTFVATAASGLPVGFAVSGAPPVDSGTGLLEVPVRRVSQLEDFGTYLSLDASGTSLRMVQIDAASLPLPEGGAEQLSADARRQLRRLAGRVKEAPDLRILLIGERPSGPAGPAYAATIAEIRRMLGFLEELAPPARLLWTVSDPLPVVAGPGRIDVVLVRLRTVRKNVPGTSRASLGTGPAAAGAVRAPQSTNAP